MFRSPTIKVPGSLDERITSLNLDSSSGALAVAGAGNMSLLKSSAEKTKTTPAGEYLTSALNEFNPDHSDGSTATDGANKLLMLVGFEKFSSFMFLQSSWIFFDLVLNSSYNKEFLVVVVCTLDNVEGGYKFFEIWRINYKTIVWEISTFNIS